MDNGPKCNNYNVKFLQESIEENFRDLKLATISYIGHRSKPV